MANASPNARFVSVVDGSTENVCGIVVCRDIPIGKSTQQVRLQGVGRKPFDAVVQLGPHVAGRVFLRNGVPYTYLWLSDDLPTAGILKIHVPGGKLARVHYNDGRTDESSDGLLRVTLDPTWQHTAPFVSGLTPAALTANATFEPTVP